MNQQWKHWVAIISLLLPAFVVAQDNKVYKVVDENGKVRYSSTPPVSGNASVDVEEVELKAAITNKTTLSQIGDNHFCGEVLLPTWPNENSGRFSEQKRQFYSVLAAEKRQWVYTVDEIEDQAHSVERFSARYNFRHDDSRQSRNNTPEKLEKARDYRCAIAWADERQDELQRLEGTVAGKIEDNGKYLEMQSTIRDRACGTEPTFNPTVNDFDIDKRRDVWRDCVAPHQELIDRGIAEREELNKELQLIYRAEQEAGKR